MISALAVAVLAFFAPADDPPKPAVRWYDGMVIPKSPDVRIRDAKGQATKATVPIYVRTGKADGDLIAIADLAAKGWVAKSDVVPIEEADAFFTEQIRLKPTAHAHLARVAVRNMTRRGEINGNDGTLAEANLADLGEAIRLDPDTITYYFTRAMQQLNRRHYDEAIADYTEYLRRIPDGIPPAERIEALRRRSDAFERKGDVASALADLDEGVRLGEADPKSAMLALQERARYFERTGRPDRAREDLDRALHANPGEFRLLQQRAALMASEWDHAGAARAYTVLIARRDIAPRTSDFLNRGRSRVALGEYEAALADFAEARKLEAAMAVRDGGSHYLQRILTDQAKALAGLGREAESRRALTELLASGPSLYGYGELQAAALLSLGRFEEAMARIEQDERKPMLLGSTLAWRGGARLAAGQWSDALADFDEAIRRDPLSVRAHSGRAAVLAAAADPAIRNGKKAAESVRRAIELRGGRHPAHRVVLALALAESGDFDAATEALDRALALLHAGDPLQRDIARIREFVRDGKPYHLPEGGLPRGDPMPSFLTDFPN